MQQSFIASLRNLGVEYVDGLVLHSPLGSFEETLEAWRALEAVHPDGARRLGISNCYDPAFFARLFDDGGNHTHAAEPGGSLPLYPGWDIERSNIKVAKVPSPSTGAPRKVRMWWCRRAVAAATLARKSS